VPDPVVQFLGPLFRLLNELREPRFHLLHEIRVLRIGNRELIRPSFWRIIIQYPFGSDKNYAALGETPNAAYFWM